MSRRIYSCVFSAEMCGVVVAIRFVERHALGMHLNGYDIGNIAIVAACSCWAGTGWRRA